MNIYEHVLTKFSEALNNDGTGRGYKYSADSWEILAKDHNTGQHDLATVILTIASNLPQDIDDCASTIWAMYDPEDDNEVHAIALYCDGEVNWAYKKSNT